MGLNWYGLAQVWTDPGVGTNYSTVVILIFTAVILAAVIIGASALVGPRRVGPEKHATYESGMEPVGDTRRRFNVRFYMIAVLFLIFDVELVFLWPWVTLYPRMPAPAGTREYQTVAPLVEQGFGPGYLLVAMGIFFVLLLVGLFYEWRRGVFKWN